MGERAMPAQRPRRRPLSAVYGELNTMLWGGQLPASERTMLYGGAITDRGVYVRRVGSRDLTGLSWRDPSGMGILGRFHLPGELTPAIIHVLGDLPAELERRTLLHEMCHLAVYLAGVVYIEPHGPAFVAELERLAGRGEGWASDEARRYAQLEVVEEAAAGS